MKKIILVDGNNLMFRSYYATAYTGNVMKNSKGFPTNALYGFVSMINKIINEEKPEYMAVAFDIGQNFRVKKYEHYKEGRIDTPEDLRKQMPLSRSILEGMGVKYFELEPYEADDIIGTLAKMAESDPEFSATIVSSDKDLLQLISPQVEVKLLKQKDHIRYNPKSFKEDWGIEPYEIIDLKALSGDSSDNIPGVKGVGEKTAITLLQKYDGLDGIYEHIDEIKGKLQEKLINDKDNAYLSKDLATIYTEVSLEIEDLECITYNPTDYTRLNEIYEDLEFYSLIKDAVRTNTKIDNEYIEIKSVEELNIGSECSYYIECDKTNYHDANILGMAITDNLHTYYVDKDLIVDALDKIKDKVIYTYDFKKNIVLLSKLGIELPDINFDTMIATYLLELSLRDDIAYVMNPKNYSVEFYDVLLKSKFEDQDKLKSEIALKSKFIFATRDDYVKELKMEDMYKLFTDIELPLIRVLADMEITGINVDVSILEDMKEETKIKIEMLSRDIFNQAGMEFNISSPKQLGEVLFERLGLPYAKRNKSGTFKTDVKVLHKLRGVHPIIDNILEYRNVNKLYTTYLEGLIPYVKSDGKIHTTYKQNLTRTGRLSSTEPNMQNIPTKDEEGRKIRKAFLPSKDSIFLCSDYSQIELRIMAHISNSKELIDTFVNDGDIHTKVAADIWGVEEKAVTKKMRSSAKAVIFGIVYGISGFGLGENLEISPKEAKEFIDKYYELYPDVKRYMDDIVAEAYDQGYVTTLFKRKRVIDELKNTNYMIRQGGERIALNTPIQGTSADIIKKAMVEIHNEFKKEKIKSKMLLQVHDELVFDCLMDEQDKVQNIVKKIMENTIELKVPLKVSADFGKNWYEAK